MKFILIALLFASSLYTIQQTIPVIFIHRGDHSYLHDSLWQARQYNPEVIMIGDHTNNHYDVAHYTIDDYFQDAADFAHIYKHLHTCNSAEYELLCIQRWFILKNFMEKHQLDRAFYCDSDVMLYCDITTELEPFKNFDIAFMQGDLACPTSHIGHISLFTQAGISMLCDYITEFYTNTRNINKWIQWLNAPERIYGEGISDMILLSQFAKSGIAPIGIINENVDNSTFDINLNQSDNFLQRKSIPLTFTRSINGISRPYQIEPVIKDIMWFANEPYAFNTQLKRLVRFKGLHFQGSLKPLMKHFRKERL